MDFKKQGFIRAMQKKREEKEKVKEFMQSDKGKDLCNRLHNLKSDIERQKQEDLKKMPF